MRLFKIFKLIILFLIFVPNLESQKIATPLTPEEMPTQKELGLMITFGQNWQSGDLFTPCNCPSFSDGTKTGFSIGPIYQQDISRSLQWGAALLFDFRGLKSSYQVYENLEATSDISNRKETVPVLFRQASDLSLTYLSLIPFIKYSPFSFMFFRLGVSGSSVIYSNLTHSKELLQTSARLSNGEVVSIKFEEGKGTTKEIYNDKLPGLNGFQFDLVPMIGFDIKAAKNVFFSPGFMYIYPLTSLSTSSPDLKSNSWRLFLELRVALSMRDSRDSK